MEAWVESSRKCLVTPSLVSLFYLGYGDGSLEHILAALPPSRIHSCHLVEYFLQEGMKPWLDPLVSNSWGPPLVLSLPLQCLNGALEKMCAVHSPLEDKAFLWSKYLLWGKDVH